MGECAGSSRPRWQLPPLSVFCHHLASYKRVCHKVGMKKGLLRWARWLLPDQEDIWCCCSSFARCLPFPSSSSGGSEHTLRMHHLLFQGEPKVTSWRYVRTWNHDITSMFSLGDSTPGVWGVSLSHSLWTRVEKEEWKKGVEWGEKKKKFPLLMVGRGKDKQNADP